MVQDQSKRNPTTILDEFIGKEGLDMKKKTAMTILFLFLVGMPLAFAGDLVTFKGTSKAEQPFMLKGLLTKPQGKGPFPAIVMLSGGRGFHEAHNKWIERFVSWKYVILQVETLSSRGLSNIFEGVGILPTISPREAAQDAYDAKAYLSGLPFVNRNQIVIVGWFFGGWAILYAIDADPSLSIQNRGGPFRAAIAFDPLCDKPLMDFDAPLLILHGELDDWHPVSRCRVIEGRSNHEIILKTYPGAYMGFDLEGIDTIDRGHRLLYDPVAAADAIEQVKNFLQKHLR